MTIACLDYLISLDADALFLASCRSDAVLLKLPGARLIPPVYVTKEAHRNLTMAVQRRELEELLGSVEVVPTVASTDLLLFLVIGLSDKTAPYWSQRSS